MTQKNPHYICTGGCKGVSEHPGVCQDPTCEKHGKPLEECRCEDGYHDSEFWEEDTSLEKPR